jgi:dihydroxy-acid dehydratase
MAKSPTTRSKAPRGMRKGLTAYGDAGFSLFLRKAFIKAAGFSDDALDRPTTIPATAMSASSSRR